MFVVAALVASPILVGLWFGLFIGHIHSQPVSGYTGDWKMHDIHGDEERPLPPAAEVWHYHEKWKLTNEWASKFYVARIGHAERQLNFQSLTNKGKSLGDRTTTYVEFLYRDPTNGDYLLTWSLIGKHDVNFLKFDDKERWVQLELLGRNTQPPVLNILGIEGFAPFHN